MTKYPYAGDGRPYTGPSYRAMAILGGLTGIIAGTLFLLMSIASTPAHAQFRQQSAWQVWSQQCALRNWGGRLPDYCINAYRALTGR